MQALSLADLDRVLAGCRVTVRLPLSCSALLCSSYLLSSAGMRWVTGRDIWTGRTVEGEHLISTDTGKCVSIKKLFHQKKSQSFILKYIIFYEHRLGLFNSWLVLWFKPSYVISYSLISSFKRMYAKVGVLDVQLYYNISINITALLDLWFKWMTSSYYHYSALQGCAF